MTKSLQKMYGSSETHAENEEKNSFEVGKELETFKLETKLWHYQRNRIPFGTFYERFSSDNAECSQNALQK